MDLAERHVVITGAAGGLGPAVVEAMLAAGAICHLPVRADGDRLPRHARILAVEGVNLADEAAVTSFYARCPPLWASIHLAGGFKAALITDTSLADLRGQLDMNLATAFLCSREAVRNMRARRRAAASSTSARARRLSRPASRRLHRVEGGGQRDGARARRRGCRERILVNAVLPGDDRHGLPTGLRCPTPTTASGRRRRTSRR
jgi:NAD(P)-dependent dehydrogenase (short-subunit alcohol dehydrogenase family)